MRTSPTRSTTSPARRSSSTTFSGTTRSRRAVSGRTSRPHPTAAPIEMPARALDIRPGNRDKGSPVELLAPAACALLRLHLVVEYPRTSMLGRPATIRVQVFDGDRTVLTRRIVPLQLGREFSTSLPQVGQHVSAALRPATCARGDAAFRPAALQRSSGSASTWCRRASISTGSSASAARPHRKKMLQREPARRSVRSWLIGLCARCSLSHRDGLSEIQVRMATWGRRNTGPLIFSLQQITPGVEPRIIASTAVDASSLVDNASFPSGSPPHRRDKRTSS